MRFQGAVVREQNVTFAVAVVKPHVIASQSSASSAVSTFSRVFPGMPVVLMAQDLRGRAKYFGRSDIARLLAKLPLRAIPWREYTLS